MLEFSSSVARMEREFGFIVAKGSIGFDEKKRSLRPESLKTAMSTSLGLLGSGDDHMKSFNQTTGIVSFTCIRSMLEPCALAVWLLDPNIDERERVGRVFAYRYAGQDQKRKFYSSANMAQEEHDARNNITKITTEARGLGYNIIIKKRGNRVEGVHTRVPSATDLIKVFLGKEAEEAYRLLSTVAHGHMWAIQSLAYRVTSNSPKMITDGVSLTKSERYDNSYAITWLGFIATLAFSKAVWAYGNYLGWDKTGLTKSLDRVFDMFMLSTNERFWK